MSKIITLCGSTRFKDTFLLINKGLTLAGYIILMPGVFGHNDATTISDSQKQQLDTLHKEKIKMSDYIYVINVDNYIGESTQSEILYAQQNNIPIYYLIPREEGDLSI